MLEQTTAPVMGYKGILFIGDMHLSSGRVGRRLDDYAEAGLAKLKQAAQICRDEKLFPVSLGDLFHKAKENDLPLLSKTMSVLREFPTVPLMVAGSHDKTESWFTEKDAAKLLQDAGVLTLLDTPGLALSLDIDGRIVTLWATPAGSLLPARVKAPTPDSFNIMVTHHDFDFKGMYPGAHELKEIEGCSLLVNGHMHTPVPPVFRGQTHCHNPGSSMRVSVDQKNQQPAVSVWTPTHGVNLERRHLKHQAHVFDLTGKEAYPASEQELKSALPSAPRLSSFAAKLRGDTNLAAGRTDDGAVLIEEIDKYFRLFEKPAVLKKYIGSLLNTQLAER